MVELLGKTYLTEKEAAQRYNYSLSWFWKSRYYKKGPNYIRLEGRGKIYYPLIETDKWFKEKMGICD